MTLHIQHYVRKVFWVEAVEVSYSNLEEIAEWCGGKIRDLGGGNKCIEVPVRQPQNERQRFAHVHDWVVHREKQGFMVYMPLPFKRTFEKSLFNGEETGEQTFLEHSADTVVLRDGFGTSYAEYEVRDDPDHPPLFDIQ